MKFRKTGNRILVWATICLAGIVTASGLWQYGGSLLTSPAPNTSYAEICDDPSKIGSPVIDVPLPTHLHLAIDAAEGDNAARMVARAVLTNPPHQMGNTEWHIRFTLTALRYRFMVKHRTLITFIANCSYFGRDTVGVFEAAQTYLGKPLSKVTLGEATLLAGLLKGPSNYHPVKHPERARLRRDMILEKMLATGKITAADMIVAKLEPVTPAKAGVQ